MKRYKVVDLGSSAYSPNAVQKIGSKIQAAGEAFLPSYGGTYNVPFLYADGTASNLATADYPSGWAIAMNGKGDVVGGLTGVGANNVSTVGYVKRHHEATTVIDGKQLSSKPGVVIANGINDSGDVVGTATPDKQTGWAWIGQKEMVDLTKLDSRISGPFDINNSKLIVGTTQSNTFFLYDLSAGIFTELPFESPGGGAPLAFINNADQIAATTPDGCLIYQSGVQIPLPLPSFPSGDLMVVDINDAGQVACSVSLPPWDGQGVFVTEPLSATAATAPAVHNVNDLLEDPDYLVIQLGGIAADGTLAATAIKSSEPDKIRGVLLFPTDRTKTTPRSASSYAQILFGIINDGDGFEHPGGHIPPWDPWVSRLALNAGQNDVLLGVAIHSLADRIADRVARRAIQELSTKLVQEAAARMNEASIAGRRGIPPITDPTHPEAIRLSARRKWLERIRSTAPEKK